MKPENYINIVEKINSEMVDYDLLFVTEGICLNYKSNGFVDIITFMGYVVFNSDIDESYSLEEHVGNIIRERMKEFTKALCHWQNIQIK